jgi:hypothetical protein
MIQLRLWIPTTTEHVSVEKTQSGGREEAGHLLTGLGPELGGLRRSESLLPERTNVAFAVSEPLVYLPGIANAEKPFAITRAGLKS